MSSGDVYVWGSARFAQLGDARDARVRTPSPAPNVKSHGVHPLHQIAQLNKSTKAKSSAGDDHSAATSTPQPGTVAFTGTPSHQRRLLEPQRLPSFDGRKFIHAAGGDGHSLFVAENGDLFSVGRNKEGQLGFSPRERTMCMVPRQVLALARDTVVQVACGSFHSVCLTNSGRVYMWGLIHVSDATLSTLWNSSAQASRSDNGEEGQDAAARGDARQMLGIDTNNDTQDIVLHRIVQESTRRYLMASDEPDQAQTEDDAEGVGTAVERDRAGDLGVVSMNSRRVAIPNPILCTSLIGHEVRMIAAGFGHTLALDSKGVVLSAGYNDRGQLGLGHRVNKPDFTPIQGFDEYPVVNIACGQQHNLAIADMVHSKAVYVWGNGSLGQLGIGRRVTGRRVPAFLSTFNEYDGAVDIAAGGNHSVVVSGDGSVFSWGHGEYGQHGSATSVSSNDLVDSFHYYIPRKVEISDPTAHFVQVECGACFTLGLTDAGEVWSWGWNGHGTLGHGKGFYNHAPMPIEALKSGDRCHTIATGSNHCIAIVQDFTSAAALQLRRLVDDATTADLKFTVEGHSRVFYAHRIIVESRSPYLSGLIAAQLEYEDARYETVERDHLEALGDDQELLEPRKILHVHLEGPVWSHITLQSLLIYLYTDRVEVPPHKVQQLLDLAREVNLDRLVYLLQVSSNAQSKMSSQEGFPSEFPRQMLKAAQDKKHADVAFVAALPDLPDSTGQHPEAPKAKDFDVVYAHSALLNRVEYFHVLLFGKFKESEATSSPSSNSIKATKSMREIDITGLIEDGIKVSTFQLLIRYLYSGATEVIPTDDPVLITEIVVLAERVGAFDLVRHCEKLLIEFLLDDQDNRESAVELAPFALSYNLHRLGKFCDEIILPATTRKMGSTVNEAASADNSSSIA